MKINTIWALKSGHSKNIYNVKYKSIKYYYENRNKKTK